MDLERLARISGVARAPTVVVEGLYAAYHQIRGSDMVEDDDTMNEALQGLYGTLDAIEWEHSSQGHGYTEHTWDHFNQGKGASAMSTWGHNSQVHDAGGSSWGQSSQSHDTAVPSAWGVGSSWGHSTHSDYGHVVQDFPQPTYGFPSEICGSGFSFQIPARGFDPWLVHDTFSQRFEQGRQMNTPPIMQEAGMKDEIDE
ncbi:hypothetical protein AgCh_034109 [Apium graveolens]